MVGVYLDGRSHVRSHLTDTSLMLHYSRVKSGLECGCGKRNRKGCGMRHGVRAMKVLLFVLSWSRYLPSGASHNSLIPSSSCGCRLMRVCSKLPIFRIGLEFCAQCEF